MAYLRLLQVFGPEMPERFSQGVSNLALIGTYCVGNNYAAKAANLRNEAKNLREEIGAQPQGSAQPALNVG